MINAVFLDVQTFSEQINFDLIESQVDKLVCYATTTPKQVLERCKNAHVIITNKVIIDEKVMTQLSTTSLICIAATGTNNVDLLAAKNSNIAVTNVSDYAGAAVSQYVFAQILAYFSQTAHYNQNTDNGHWQNSATFCHHGLPITELSGKTLGLVGYGHVAKAVEKVALAFDMKVLIAEHRGVTKLRDNRHSFEQVIAQSDVISIHCPLTENTFGLFNSQCFALMKPNAMLINTARGAIVDKTALLSALVNKQLAFAVLDVLDVEPPNPDHLLMTHKLDNLKITAHIAWASQEAQQRLVAGIAQNIKAFNQGIKHNRVEC